MFEEQAKTFASATLTDKELEVLKTVHDWGQESLSPEERHLFGGISDRQLARQKGFEAGAKYVYETMVDWHYIDKVPLPEQNCLVETVNGAIRVAYYLGGRHLSESGGVLEGIFKWKAL